MCGGNLNIVEGMTVCECEYCGSTQTVPQLDDEKKINLFSRANRLRFACEYDRAFGIYENIVIDFPEEAEAYWGILLCKYGIEYVDDPATGKKIPTCHRSSFDSIFDDENFEMVMEYSDPSSRSVYREEAKEIEALRTKILEVSSKEEPYDIFICYKETDAIGQRTIDSVIAQDVYEALTKTGYRVFFSRISLEDKLGQEYEPYIFAALNSAKVMVVLGTKAENFNAVWVKNEWCRFLALIKKGERKVLIPAYKDMDPYDLPEEFSHLQAQDMSRLGFMQDLVRGIKKMVAVDEPKPVVKENATVSAEATNTAPLLKRAFMFLEDGDWQSADEYCEKVLDMEPENAQAYLGKLMTELRVSKPELLAKLPAPFANNNNYQKAVRFGNDNLKATLNGYNNEISKRNELARLDGLYSQAINIMQSAKEEQDYQNAANSFKQITQYKDSKELAEECLEKAEAIRKDKIYTKAMYFIKKETINAYNAAIEALQKIPGWKDADEQIVFCKNKIIEIEAIKEAARIEAAEKAEKRKTVLIIGTVVAMIIITIIIIITTVIIPNVKYKTAVSNIEKGNIIEGYESLVALNGYKDSAEKASEVDVKYKTEKLKVAEVGDNIFFGTYEQDNDTSNGKEDIEWLVLAKEENKVLIISRYALDCKKYNTSNTGVTWEICSLRKWLNGAFISNAFSSDEQSMIQSTTVTADKNPSYSTSPGNNTTDKVFLLSITELNKYFSTDTARQCQATAYAKERSLYTESGNGNCWWWLRSPGDYSDTAASVKYDGNVYTYGSIVDCNIIAVRPALWIDISK